MKTYAILENDPLEPVTTRFCGKCGMFEVFVGNLCSVCDKSKIRDALEDVSCPLCQNYRLLIRDKKTNRAECACCGHRWKPSKSTRWKDLQMTQNLAGHFGARVRHVLKRNAVGVVIGFCLGCPSWKTVRLPNGVEEAWLDYGQIISPDEYEAELELVTSCP